jgi:hypothetical protein
VSQSGLKLARFSNRRCRGVSRHAICLGLLIALLPCYLSAQEEASTSFTFTGTSEESGVVAGTQPSAWRIERFSRLSFYTAVSPLGIGEHVSTNISPYVDLRIFENFLPVHHSFTQSSFDNSLDIQFANAGVSADYYPFHHPFHVSPGYLFYNRNRVNGTFIAQPNAVFTINNVDWYSDNQDPVHGTGRLDLGGSGFMITAGYGRITSHSERHFTFPIEAGVAFINQPKASVVFSGQICDASGANCQPAATYPGFADAVTAQLATWNRNIARFHIYPLIEGGVAYTFDLRRRSLARSRE